MDCIFCKLVKGEVPTRKIYEDKETVAILDINPASPGHALVIPKKHFKNIYEVNDSVLNDAMRVVKLIAERVKNRLRAEGVNVLQNNDRHAGQLVDHIHFHVIPRYTNDEVVIRFPRAQLSESEMKSIQEKLSEEEPKSGASYGSDYF